MGSWRLYGSVKIYSTLDCDPTLNGGNCENAGATTTYSKKIKLKGRSVPSYQAKVSGQEKKNRRQKAKNQIKALYSKIDNQSNHPKADVWVRQIHSLLRLYDDSIKTLRKWSGFDQRLKSWKQEYLTDERNRMRSNNKPLFNKKKLGRAALIIDLHNAIQNGQYEKALEQTDTYASHFSDIEGKISLLSAKAVAWEQTEQFGKALAAYEYIEELLPVPKDSLNISSSYEVIKAELADSMEANKQVKGKLSVFIKQKKTEISEKFELLAPYPNPFNPSTTIPFNVAKSSSVKITVYNMLGQKVATLVNRKYDPGSYQVDFNAKHLASGVYFIRTEMDNRLFNRKVTLIK